MAKLGFLKNSNGVLVGRIRTLKMVLDLTITKNAEKTGDTQPDYIAWAKGADGVNTEVGAGFEKKPRNGGHAFISLTIDDMSFPMPLNVTAFQIDNTGDIFEVVWRRPVKQSQDQQEAA